MKKKEYRLLLRIVDRRRRKIVYKEKEVTFINDREPTLTSVQRAFGGIVKNFKRIQDD